MVLSISPAGPLGTAGAHLDSQDGQPGPPPQPAGPSAELAWEGRTACLQAPERPRKSPAEHLNPK
eukprot:13736881-Alexandrium_andersonii.AAC.1